MERRDDDWIDPIVAANPIDGDRLTSSWSSSPARAALIEELTMTTTTQHAPQGGDIISLTTSLRRHTSGFRLATAAAAVAALAAVAIAIWPGPADPAWAGWTPTTQPTTSQDIAAIGDACTAALSGPRHPEPGQPIATDIRGEGGFVVFDNGATCSARRRERTTAYDVATSSYSWDINLYRQALDQLGATASLVSVLASESNDPANSFVWGVRSPDIHAVTIDTPHGPVEATVTGAVWLAWWPEATGFDLTLRGTGTDGTVLITGTFDELGVAADDHGHP